MINNRINIHTTGFLSSIFITDTGPCSTQGDDDIYSNNLQIFPFVLTLRISQGLTPPKISSSPKDGSNGELTLPNYCLKLVGFVMRHIY